MKETLIHVTQQEDWCRRLRTLSYGTGKRERSGAELLKYLSFNWFT